MASEFPCLQFTTLLDLPIHFKTGSLGVADIIHQEQSRDAQGNALDFPACYTLGHLQ